MILFAAEDMGCFQGCWERIKRADSTNRALARAWNRFAQNDSYSVAVHVYYGGTGRITVSLKRPFPSKFALYLGEILYHFRAALDECVYRAAIIETGKSPPSDAHRLNFPVYPDETQFKKAVTSLPLRDKLRAVIESVQPYKTPKLPPELIVLNYNRALGILHKWARRDRHRQLHVMASWASSARKIILPGGVMLSEMTITSDGLLKNEHEIATFKLTGYKLGMAIEANPDLMIDVAVDEFPPPCAHNDTLGERLRTISLAVKSIVHTFETVLNGGPSQIKK